MADYVQKVIIDYTKDGETDTVMIDFMHFGIDDIKEIENDGATIDKIMVETDYDIEQRVKEQMRRHREFMAQPRPTYECPF